MEGTTDMESSKQKKRSGGAVGAGSGQKRKNRLSMSGFCKMNKPRSAGRKTGKKKGLASADNQPTIQECLTAVVCYGKNRLAIRRWTRDERLSAGALSGLLTIFLVFSHFFLLHRVAGSSMAPALSDKNRILIAKTADPKRYDIVTFHPANEPEGSYVKRVMGLPGDGLWVADEHTLFLKEGSAFSEKEKSSGELPEGCVKFSLSLTASTQLGAFEAIPKAMYFVVGDNRGDSTDSRIFGLVKASQLEGVVIGRYFPFTQWGRVS